MKRKYHVAYFYWTEGVSSGFGSMVITEGEDEDIYTEDELNVINAYIRNLFNYSGCVILNIIPLNA